MNIIDNFDNSIAFSNILYNKPIRHSTYYQSNIKYNNEDMIIQSPFLKVVKNNFYENNSNSFFTISFTLLNNKSCKNFFKTIYDIEDYNCNIIHQKSEEWFGKKIPLNILYKKHVQPWDINRDGEIVISFHLLKSKDKWQIVDVDLDGISMRNNLRSQVYKIISKNNYQELVLRMEKKLKNPNN